MMKLKAVKNFNDKVTGKLVTAGTEFTVEDERGKEILASKWKVAELVEASKDKKDKDKKDKE